MSRRHLLFFIITVIGVASVVMSIHSYPDTAHLPFNLKPSVNGELVALPAPGLTLPSGLMVGDTFDWRVMTSQEREVLSNGREH